MKNFFLFTIPALIWGSTWLAIKFQLGDVDPLISVFYRFFLASLILMIYCYIRGLNLKYTVKQHLLMMQLGIFLFGINYWLVYLAEMHLTSGLVAIVFSTIVFLNIFNAGIFLRTKISVVIIISAVIGFAGISLIFKNELLSFTLSSGNSLALLLALLGAILASFGNIISGYSQRQKIPVIQSNVFGMLYGSLLMLVITLVTKKTITFDFSNPYIFSLLYLSIFGSIIAFSTYLTLLGQIGAEKSGYIALVIPVIALILSTIFENYKWNLFSLTGVVLIILGNVLVLRKKNKGMNNI